MTEGNPAGVGLRDVVGGDRHGVERHASAGREPLPEWVRVAVDHHAGKGGTDHHGEWFAGVRPHGEAVGDQDTGGKALTAGQHLPLAVAGECQSRFLREATGADELLVTTITHGYADRVRSYRLLAEEWRRR